MAMAQVSVKVTLLVMNIHQTKAHARFLRSIGWKVESLAYIRTLPLLPISILKLQRVKLEDIDWTSVTALQKKYHVYETLIELDQLDDKPQVIEIPGFKPAADFMLTTKTRIIDLTQSENQLLSAMKPKTRYNIHVAQKNSLTATIWSTQHVAKNNELFEVVYGLLRDNAKRIQMLLLPKSWIKKQFECFGNDGFVVGVFRDEQLLNVAVFYCSDTTCSYNHNGSIEISRRFMGPTLAVWAGMREGKRRGLSLFDFDGVFDERYPKRQSRFKGFGRFKEGFGGSEFYFPPMYRKFRNPIK
jgi:lipid II:glycine glycyltransferase (peptidoglycan interpeptide bridge formation enzyme)